MTKKIKIFLLILALSDVSKAQYQVESFDSDSTYYLNPIFAGDHPNPSIICDGKDYYMVHSSFEYYPGLTIWHSRDLINWSPIVNALHKYVGSVWAPDLVKYNNKYFIYFPANNTNYVITANAIEGPWSDPVDLKIGNIDPGHITDDKGNRYLYFSSGGYVPLSRDGLSLSGEFVHSYDGWPIPNDWSIEGFFMEGPKLVKHGEYYYLTVAEGGTAGPPTGHMVISARSKSPLGPWENSPYNPIARTKDKSEHWWSIGHATLFANAEKNWWMMLHGYENGHYNMGRQTLLLPVEWTNNGWFKIPAEIKLDNPIMKPSGEVLKQKFSLNDAFDGKLLKSQWKFFGEYDTSRFKVTDSGLLIKAKGNSVSESSPLLCVPTDHSYSAQIEVNMEGNVIAGLVLFYSAKAYSGILADSTDILANLRGWQFPAKKQVISRHVFLKLKNVDDIVDMFYSFDGKNWIKIENSSEVSGFHHNALSDFLSLRIGLVSMGNGKVIFSNFKYQAIKVK
jgi:beta-xylosidase